MRYDYLCNDCGLNFEITCKIGEFRGTVACPTCGSGDTRRAYTMAPAVVFNWWNAAASDSAGLDYQRFLPAVKKKTGGE